MQKKGSLVVVSLGVLVALSGCSASKMTHDEYMNYDGMMSRYMKRADVTVNVPLKVVVSRLRSQSERCAPKVYKETSYKSNGLMEVNVVNNNITVEQVSSTKAKYTVQQRHSNMLLQPKDGIFFAAADLQKISGNRTNIKAVSAKTFWLDTIQAWAKGGTKCLGVGGKK